MRPTKKELIMADVPRTVDAQWLQKRTHQRDGVIFIQSDEFVAFLHLWKYNHNFEYAHSDYYALRDIVGDRARKALPLFDQETEW